MFTERLCAGRRLIQISPLSLPLPLQSEYSISFISPFLLALLYQWNCQLQGHGCPLRPLMSSKFPLSVLLSLAGRKQHLAPQLCGTAARSREEDSRSCSLPQAGDLGYSHQPPVTETTFCWDMTKCFQLPGMHTPNCFSKLLQIPYLLPKPIIIHSQLLKIKQTKKYRHCSYHASGFSSYIFIKYFLPFSLFFLTSQFCFFFFFLTTNRRFLCANLNITRQTLF